eukprot:364447-Chlamydomonas_euryale.AAC.10
MGMDMSMNMGMCIHRYEYMGISMGTSSVRVLNNCCPAASNLLWVFVAVVDAAKRVRTFLVSGTAWATGIEGGSPST